MPQTLMLFIFLLWISFSSFATDAKLEKLAYPPGSSPSSSLDTQELARLYHSLGKKLNMASRLNLISHYFLGKPYELGALGEGPKGRFDQWPLYRMDSFDCETYVDTVLALSLTNNSQDFKVCINKIRYHQGKVDFKSRNHFTALDWNAHNQEQGYLKDITATLQAKTNPTLMATAWVDKASWYEHLDQKAIRFLQPNQALAKERIEELRKEGKTFKVRQERIPYLPLERLFDQNGKANCDLFKQIPDAALMEIVRPNWDLRASIGTAMNVSHLGFVFWQKAPGTLSCPQHGKELRFRHASSEPQKVVDVSLIDYLRKLRDSPTIKGINLQVIVPKAPLAQGC